MIWQFMANGHRNKADVEVHPPRTSTASGGKTIEPQVEVRFVGPEGSEGYMMVTLSSDEAEQLAAQLTAAASDARDLFSAKG